MTAVRLLTPEWHAVRRESVTGTDIPVLLGLSRWKSEATLAAEKLGEAAPEPENAAMRIGRAMEDIVRDEYQLETGRRLRHVRRLMRFSGAAWAAASLDFETVGEKRIVEAKTTNARKPDDELPQDWEAQVRWQMGCAGYPVADVAALYGGRELRIHTVKHDPALFAALLDIAADFRRRLAAGGPFAHDAASLKRAYPADDGTEIVADDELDEAVKALLEVRASIERMTKTEEVLQSAIKSRMADASALRGTGYRITWRRASDSRVVDYEALVAELSPAPEVIAKYTTVKPGTRRFLLRSVSGDE